MTGTSADSGRELLLRAKDISIIFGGLRAVSDFSLELYQGELVGLIGPNGAGKTTVFNMLSGIYRPTSGSITFVGRDGNIQAVNGKSPAQLNKIGIARTFQNIRLFGKLTAAENIKIALHHSRQVSPVDVLFRTGKFRADEKIMQEKTELLLSIFHLESKVNELACNLAYGDQRKLEICRALASSPKLLLLDEPAAGMNGQETQELMELISFIREKFNLTVLLIEHDMKLVMGICERLMVLNYGRVIASGLPSEIQSNEEVIKAYLGSGYEAVGGKK
ncbi:ABC transporter ATP-binding protein [Treponema sp.]|uniref:ABC transporter ATP-binding protein n=1 Tax=Treponema sp. TaxID=166 RepID=UPI003F0DFCD4